VTNETTKEETQQRIIEVLRGCPDGRHMDEESLCAAVKLLTEVELRQAVIQMLQRGDLIGRVDANGEVAVRSAAGEPTS
jgi:hypothetical protein